MGFFIKSNHKKKSNSCCGGNIDDLIIKEDQEDQVDQVESGTCGSGNDGSGDESERDRSASKYENNHNTTVIKILGSGCKNCITLAENVKQALEEMNLQAEIVKVTDFAEITGYGVMTTPAMVVNEKVVSYGKVLKPNEVVKILKKVL